MNTTLALMVQFNGRAVVPLEEICLPYLGLDLPEAKRKAAHGDLPVKAFKLGGQKSPLLVNVIDLARLMDEKREAA